MAALARILSSFSTTDIDFETLKTLVIFSGLGLLASLVCVMAYGLDLSGGFF